ncbi:hypothetical protein C9374_010995 [Naegleria lovaniensis]|uniref:Uncharacterized protein n=1 Tax=Naegleria lovaniensis TaxID=51637 RepID=A0AA88GFX7_NAELO|nr:uncharacterized protein C9374_010995 [Naegleria lovaniensis]KAG2374158.1 hypothetical protein C9374_010995 [Naegleria lovaniensis]
MGIGSSHRSERDASLANIPYQSSLTSHIMETKRKNNSGNSLNTLIHPSTTTSASSTIPTDMSPNHQLPNLENSIVQEKNHSSLLQHSHHHDSILQFIEIPNRDTLQHFTDYYYSMCVPNDWRVEVYGPTTNASRGGGIVISGTSTLNPPPQTTTTTNPMNYSNGVTSPMTMMENVNSGVSTCEGNHTGNSNSTTTTTTTTTASSSSSSSSSSTLNHSVNVNTSSPALNASSSSQIMNGQKIYFSTYDKNVEKDFIEIYVTFSPNDIEKEAKLAIDDIHQMGQQENHEDDYFGRHSSHSLQNQTHASQTLTTNHLKRMPSSHAIRQGMSQMSQQAGFSRVIEPKIVKGITHVIGKKIQPEKKALYFIMQFRHELLPQKLLYKKIYFIQEGNGIIYCLTLTTTRREPEDVIGYTSVTPSPLLTSRENQSARSARSSSIPAIHIESHTCHSPSNSSSVTPPTTHSKNLSLSVTSVAFESNSSTSNSANSSPNLNGEPTSNNNNTTLTTVSNSQPNSARKRNSSSGSAPKKTFMKMVTSALSTSAIESDSGDEMTILTGFIPSVLYHSVNSQSMASQQQSQPVLDGGVWSDILVRELFVGKSLKELKRKTSNMDGEGVIIHVPICFIPSLRLETDGEQEIIKHYGISDFGKRKEDYKLLLYHPIQYLSRGPYSTKEEMVENIFVTHVDFVLKHTTTVYEKKNLIEFYWNADVCGNCEKLEEEITLLTMPTEKNSGKLLNFFYERIFKEKVKKSFTLLNEKSMEFSSVMNHQSVDSNLGNNTSIITPQMTMHKAKYLELDGNTYFGNTLKKQCCLVERNFKIWIFTYSSTNNLIASEAFHTILSEIKYTS